ncbi:MAG: hypothetical protein Q7S29_05720 [Candidatus Peribacter sp.]|nr:hypothetical protein [Candidatus Peribacter sp.]
MIRQHSLIDLSIGAVVVLMVCALVWSLHIRSTAIPRVLAQSTVCPSPPSELTKVEGGFIYSWSGWPGCQWRQQTIDPPVATNNPYCCLSNGRTARCVMLRAGTTCVPNLLETDVKAFEYSDENNQQACEEQRRTGVCNEVPASSVSSSSRSSVAAGCGNNLLETASGEECDWGGNNSNSLRNRCRANCKFPTCGDGLLDDNFSDPVSGTMIAEECDPGADITCRSDCTVEQAFNPLFFMFPSALESPLYVVRNVFDWNSIFFPLSSLGF